MSFLQKAKEAAAQAAAQARQPAGTETPASGWGQPVPAADQEVLTGSGWVQGHSPAQKTSATETAREAFGLARKGLGSVIDKIDAGTMADIVIRATALQEKTNKALRLKGSPYRISEISISASIPPAVEFAISRIGDIDEEITGEEVESTEILAEAGDTGALVLEGADPDSGEVQITS
jgi:hypothetical protein